MSPGPVHTVHVLVPAGIDDPARVSGGNRYDRRVCDGLRAAGWTVGEVVAEGAWPRPDAGACAGLARALDALPAAALVVVDGLVAAAARAVLVPRAERLRLVVLVHMVSADVVGDAVRADDEAAVLGAARAVVTTSGWTRARLLERYPLLPSRVHTARPGVQRAPVGSRAPGGGRLLCVGTLSPLKGQDLLVEALGRVADLPWRCALVGPRDRDRRFVASLEHRAGAARIADRVRMPGTGTAAAVREEYRAADLLVVPSRTEAYGMVVTEALAAGVPVLATAVGGIPEAVGRSPRGVPGLLVPPDDAGALAAALVGWLTDAGLRRRLRTAALARREALPDWRDTAGRIAAVLLAVGAEPDRPGGRAAR